MRTSAIFILCCLGCVGVNANPAPETLVSLDALMAPPEPPNVRLWSEMDAQSRAQLWPFLDSVTRSTHWRDMSKKEREDMRSFLSPAEVEKIRRRYCFTEDQQAQHRPRPGVRPLREHDKSLMRQQIMEVHIEMFPRGAHAHRLRPNGPADAEHENN